MIIIKKLQRFGKVESIVLNLIQASQSDSNNITDDRWLLQKEIGLSKLWQGKISKDIIEATIPQLHKPKKEKQLYTNLLILMIKQWKAAWIHRLNSEKDTDKTHHVHTIEKDNNRLKYLYEHQQFLTQQDRKVMFQSFQEHKRKAPQIHNWLHLHYYSLKESIQNNIKLFQIENQNPDLRIPSEAP